MSDETLSDEYDLDFTGAEHIKKFFSERMMFGAEADTRRVIDTVEERSALLNDLLAGSAKLVSEAPDTVLSAMVLVAREETDTGVVELISPACGRGDMLSYHLCYALIKALEDMFHDTPDSISEVVDYLKVLETDLSTIYSYARASEKVVDGSDTAAFFNNVVASTMPPE